MFVICLNGRLQICIYTSGRFFDRWTFWRHFQLELDVAMRVATFTLLFGEVFLFWHFWPCLVNHREDDSHYSLVALCIVFTLQVVYNTLLAMIGCLHCTCIDSICCTDVTVSFADVVDYSFSVTANEDSWNATFKTAWQVNLVDVHVFAHVHVHDVWFLMEVRCISCNCTNLKLLNWRQTDSVCCNLGVLDLQSLA